MYEFSNSLNYLVQDLLAVLFVRPSGSVSVKINSAAVRPACLFKIHS